MAAEGRSRRTPRVWPSSCGGSRPAASWLRPGSRQELAAAVTGFRASWPSLRRAGRLWAPAFLAPAPTPFASPPPGGAGAAARGPLNPGRTGGRLAGTGEQARRAVARGGAPSTARGGGGTLAGCGGWGVGCGVCGGGRDSCRRGHASALTRKCSHSGSHPLLRCPRTCGPHPRSNRRDKRQRRSQVAGRLLPFISGAKGKQPFSMFT